MKALTTKTLLSEELKSTIKKLMALHGINMNQLHKHTGVPLTTINRIVNETNVNPTISSLIPIADYFGVTLNQLMGIDPLNSVLLIGRYSKKRELWTDVPIITWEDAIYWPNNLTNLQLSEAISVDILLGKNPFALIITDSNLEGFFPGSIIIINPEATLEHGDYSVVHKSGLKKASLKQILIDDDKTYLRPLSKDYQTQLMDETYKILGTVAQIRMDRK